MKTRPLFRHTRLLIAWLLLCPFLALAEESRHVDTTANWLEPWLFDATSDFQQLERWYTGLTTPIRSRLTDVKQAMRQPAAGKAETGFLLLRERLQLEDTLELLEAEHELKRTKLRYRKGIEILKMLYEKILSMEHHFSGLQAQQDILNISNPHNYPEFKETSALLDAKMNKRYGLSLGAAFQQNPYLAAAFSLIGLVISGGDAKIKKADLGRITCILDFTVRIHNDLNIIYFETGYLLEANLTLKRDCELLFAECARQVGYTIPLDVCRNTDDWERLYTQLDALVARSMEENASSNTLPDTKLALQIETNLRFSIDRLLYFINRYGDVVNQGNEYYKKFSNIIRPYETEETCSAVLPGQFRQLKTNIEGTIEKFNTAYRMPEVQGSKLKDMLYGSSE